MSANRHGDAGRKVMVRSNMFPLTLSKPLSIHQYDVAITPMFTPAAEFTLPPNKALEILTRLQNANSEIFNPRGAFDGKHIFWSTVDLPFNGGIAEFSIALNEQDPSRAPRANPNLVKVAFSRVAVINNEMLETAGEHVGNPNALIALNMMNVLLRIAPVSKWPHNARSFFTNSGKRDLRGLELWKGYFQSIRPVIGNHLAVNVDVSAGVMIPAKTKLMDLAMKYLGLRNARELTEPRNFQRLRSLLRGLTIEVNLPKHRGRVKKVANIVPGGGTFEFTTKDGTKLTVEQHLLQAHNTRIQFKDLPGVCVGRSDVFPIELCLTGKPQLFRSKLSAEFTTAMIDFTSQRPAQRLEQIRKGWNDLEYHNSDYVRNAGMEISSNPLSVTARILNTPNIKYQTDSVRIQDNKRGAWNIMNKKFVKPANLDMWAVISFAGEEAAERDLKAFVRGLGSVLTERGLTVVDPGDPTFSHPTRIEDGLDDVCKNFPQVSGKRIRVMILIILRENSQDAYDRIKAWGNNHRGVITQCIKWTHKFRNFDARRNNQYFNNVALKINGKMDGINSIPNDPYITEFASVPTMVVGADVSHPGPGDSSRPSISALVASWDPFACQYIADIRPQPPRVEIIQNLEEMMIRMLENFVQKNSNEKSGLRVPQRIVYYRDGVSEGELPSVRSHELQAIRSAVDKKYAQYGIPETHRPTLTMIVVAKRHHVRFFPQNPQNPEEADQSGNCIAGSVVDVGIVHPALNDFFLQSHAGLKGTSRPAHYIVIFNNNTKWDANMLQGLSYSLCHVYFPATRSVSIPAPVYYADTVCQGAKSHFGNWIDDSSSVHSDHVPSYEEFIQQFRPIHPALSDSMYWL